MPKFQIFDDKMCKYAMDLMSFVEDTERTRFCSQTDRRTDWQTDRRTRWYQYTPFQLRWSGGYNNWPSLRSWGRSKKVKGHNVSLTSYQLTSLWFHGLPIPEIQHFQSLTLKIQGQGHSSRSQRRYTTLSIHILFVPCQSALPFLGYSYFKIWHWKFKVKVMGEVKVESHNMGPTFSQLTSLSFQVNGASNCWVTTFPKFDLESQGSRSWVKSKLKVTTWVQHSVDSHPFPSMWIGHPIPQLRLFYNLTLKIKGQGHGWGHSSKSQCGSSILSTHIPLVPCQSVLPSLRYSIFKIWPWKSRVKVMGEITVQSHNVGLTSYWLTSLSFHVNRPSHSWDTFSKFDLENQGSRSNDPDVAQLQV